MKKVIISTIICTILSVGLIVFAVERIGNNLESSYEEQQTKMG